MFQDFLKKFIKNTVDVSSTKLSQREYNLLTSFAIWLDLRDTEESLTTTTIGQGRIEIEEMPQGCVLSQIRGNGKFETVVVYYPDDAIAIIKSLREMIAIQYPEHQYEIE